MISLGVAFRSRTGRSLCLSIFAFLLVGQVRAIKETSFKPCPASRDAPVIGTADIIVIGSGPGGAGFLHRLTRLQPDKTVIWIEKGRDFLARNWPQDIEEQPDVLTPVPRDKMWWVRGYAWNNFGGGDAGNSGGPNYDGIQRPNEPYNEVDVVMLRNNSLIPLTPASTRWRDAFNESGFEDVGALYHRNPPGNRIGQMSSLRTPDGRERLLLANDIRYSNDNKVTYVHAKVTNIEHDGKGRATGVRGVRIDGDQGEYGGCVTWNANTAVVLAAGVFHTFDLLIESGIGPQEYLDARQVEDVWYVNPNVGKGFGDEHASVFLGVEPEPQDQFGAEARLAGDNTDDVSFVFWSTGIFQWLRFKSYFFNKLLGGIFPDNLPGLYHFTRAFLTRVSMMAVGMASGPVMSLVAVPKPNNRTRAHRRNPIGIRINDTAVEFTDEMCAALANSLEPLKKGAELQIQAKNEQRSKTWQGPLLAILSSTNLLNLIRPNAITAQNVDRYTGRGSRKGTKCKLSMLASYFHFYGGCSMGVVNESYEVIGTRGLYISDGSVLRLVAGPPSTTIMQQGMKVADEVSKLCTSKEES